MADAARAAAGSGPAPASRVMLLSLWAGPGQAWHARLVATDAVAHDFDSPFELARFLAQPPLRAPPAAPQSLK